MARHLQRSVDLDPRLPDELHARGFADVGAFDAGGPDDGAGRNLLATGQTHRTVRHRLDLRSKHHLDALALERAAGGLAQRRDKSSKNMRRRFYKHHADLVYVELAVILAQDEPDQLRDRPCHLDAGRPSPDDREAEQRPAPVGVARPARGFKPREDAVAQREALVEIFQAQPMLGHRHVAEVIALGAGGQHEVVVGNRVLVREQSSPNEVNAGDRGL